MVNTENKDKKRRTYWNDWDFYLYWLLCTPDFYGDAEYLRVSIFEDESWEYKQLFIKLDRFLKEVWVETNHLATYSNASIDYKTTEKQIKIDYPNDKLVLTSYRKIRKWTFNFQDLLNTFGYFPDLNKVIYFPFNYSTKELATIYNYINAYIDEFVNHELIVSRSSLLVFEKQKEWLIKTIQKMEAIEKFWNNFIISKKSYEDKEVLFFHTLYALEKLGYIEVISLWSTRNSNNEKIYHSNIIVNESFVGEINQEFKKTNPEKYLEKFDSKTGILTFGGKKIELSKNGKETDPVLLMKTLIKKEEWEWVHNDEIFEDWGIREDEQVSKNKIYFALQKINTTMGLVAQIDDFIEWGTKKARINPKYRKVGK